MRRRDHVDRVTLNETEVANHGQDGFTRWTCRQLAGKTLLRDSQTPCAFQGRRDRRFTHKFDTRCRGYYACQVTRSIVREHQLTESVRLPSRRHDRTDPRRGSSEPVGYGSGGGGARGGDLGTRFWRLNARAVTAATTAATITNPTAKPRGRRDPELGDPMSTCCV